MAKLVIKGHTSRGEEVIKILEMLGGENKEGHNGNNPNVAYYISHNNNTILCDCISNIYPNIYKCIDYTLEEFLEKFPYKIGDKVKCWINGYCSINNIKDIQWDSITNEIKYKIQDYWYSTMNLQPYKEETMENKPDLLQQLKEYFENTPRDVIEKEWYEYNKYNEIGPSVNEYLEYVNSIKQPQYPKTYEKCCEVLGIDTQFCMKYLPHGTLSYKDTLIYNLQALLICRDAYWKIAGEQMGLGKSWDSIYGCGEWGYWIGYDINANKIYCQDSRILLNHLLVFPTKEMRDAFKENFDDDIDICKEFL